MTYRHQRIFTELDREIYATIGRSMAIAGTTEVSLDTGGFHAQKKSNRCAAAGVWNALETYDDRHDLPDHAGAPTPPQIYDLSREIDPYQAWEKGTDLYSAAEATCELVGTGLRWMALPHNEPEILAAWLATERTGIAYGSVWTMGHANPTKRVMLPTQEQVGDGHAFHICGFKAAHTFRTYPWPFGKKLTIPVFLCENSHDQRGIFFLPASGVPLHGLAAIVFIPPNY